MGISVESIWSQAQRLSDSERLALSRRLRESVGETETARRERVASEIDRFFGGWSDDPRTTDEVMNHIRAGRTANTFPKHWPDHRGLRLDDRHHRARGRHDYRHP